MNEYCEYLITLETNPLPMKRLKYNYFKGALIIFILLHNCNFLYAQNEDFKIEQIRFNNLKMDWGSLKIGGNISFDSLDSNGFPINLIILNWNPESVSFKIKHSNNKEQKYRYKLIGHTEAWAYLDTTNWASFSNINAIKYCFVVQELSQNRVTSELKYIFYSNADLVTMRYDFVRIILAAFFIIIAIKLK